LLKGAFVAHPSFNRVRLGVKFVLYGLVLTLLTYIGVVIFVIACFFYLLSTGRTVPQLLQDPPIGIVIPAVVLSILPIAALLLNFLGKLLSLGSSEEIPARWAVVLSLLLDVATVVASFILFWTAPIFAGLPNFKVSGVLALSAVLSPIGFVPYAFFLQRLGSWKLTRSPIEEHARQLLILGGVVTVLFLVAYGLVSAGQAADGGGFGGLGVLLGFVFVARYIALLATTKDVLAVVEGGPQAEALKTRPSRQPGPGGRRSGQR
jgi:hypothetical protein